MAEKILLEIVTPEKKVLSETVDIVVAPGELGEFPVVADTRARKAAPQTTL